MKTITLHHTVFSALGAILLSAVAFGSGVGAVSMLQKITPGQQVAAVALFPASISLDTNTLIAKADIVYDPTDGRILFSKNSSAPLPLASLTKLMTATAVLEGGDTGRSVQITAADLAPEGDWGFKAGDTVPLSSLLKIGLIASSNDAMAAAAASLGDNYLDLMNARAKTLGLSHMYFLNPTGLDESAGTAGAYGSAFDVARLAAHLFQNYPDYFGLTTQPNVSIQDGTRTLKAAATALPLAGVPGVVAAKTGFTDLAGGNLAVVFDIAIGHPLVAVVLGSTEDARFDDIKKLIQAVRDAQSTQTSL
ncbi:MAG: serine hydrolase [Candidatus Adlerbacteria bacterium]|nr:serine hydrolase [Candidatus Adlerbacteria bacterium]